MKVLVYVGNLPGNYGLENKLDLAMVWVDDENQVHVQAIKPEYEEFARAVQENIDGRIGDSIDIDRRHRTEKLDPFRRWKGSVTITKDSFESETHVQYSEPGKENFLAVLRSDRSLVGNRRGEGIAGYEISESASYVTVA